MSGSLPSGIPEVVTDYDDGRGAGGLIDFFEKHAAPGRAVPQFRKPVRRNVGDGRRSAALSW